MKKSFDELAYQHLYKQSEAQYKSYLAQKEARIRKEEKARQKEEVYNQAFDRKLQAKINRIDDAKQRRRNYIRSLMGLLLGDKNDPSIPSLILGILTAPHPGFLRLCEISTKSIRSVSAISPIVFGATQGIYKYTKRVVIRNIKPFFRPKIFAAVYRSWCDQFVRKIIEKRQRGPPFI